MTQEWWVVYWAGFASLVGLATLGVLLMTAHYARSLFQTTAQSAKITLTNDVINSEWCVRGLKSFGKFFQGQGSDPQKARDFLKEMVTNAQQFGKKHPQLEALESDVLGAYVYMALLYRRGVLDDFLLIESGLAVVTFVSYVGSDYLLLLVRSGYYDPSILEFGNACIKRFIRRPGMAANYPYLKDFRLRL